MALHNLEQRLQDCALLVEDPEFGTCAYVIVTYKPFGRTEGNLKITLLFLGISKLLSEHAVDMLYTYVGGDVRLMQPRTTL